MASSTRKTSAAAGVSAALERLCDTHAGLSVAPAVQQLSLQIKAINERLDEQSRSADKRQRALQEYVEAAYKRLEDDKFKRDLQKTTELLAKTLAESQARVGKVEEGLEAAKAQTAQTVDALEARLVEQASMLGSFSKLLAESRTGLSSFEERVEVIREVQADSGLRLQKFEVNFVKVEKITARLLELGQELEPFSRDMKQAKKAIEELKASTEELKATAALHETALESSTTSVLDAGEVVAELRGQLTGLPERLAQLEGNHAKTKELASSTASSVARNQEASEERLSQLDSVLRKTVTEVQISKKAIEPLQDLAAAVGGKCDTSKLADLAEVVQILQGEVETTSRSMRKVGTAVTALEATGRQDTTAVKASLAAAVQKMDALEQDLETRLEEKASKATFQQVRATLLNLGMQVNELNEQRRSQDATPGGARVGAAPAPTDSLGEARLAALEESLHAKANRTETSDISVALNKVMRRTGVLEEEATRFKARADALDMSIIRVDGILDSEGARANQFEGTLSLLAKRASDVSAKIEDKAEAGAVIAVELALRDAQTRVHAVQVKAEQLEADGKSKATTAQMQTLASTMASLTHKLAEHGRLIGDTVASSQDAKDALTVLQRLVAKGASPEDIARLSTSVQIVSKRVEVLEEARR